MGLILAMSIICFVERDKIWNNNFVGHIGKNSRKLANHIQKSFVKYMLNLFCLSHVLFITFFTKNETMDWEVS